MDNYHDAIISLIHVIRVVCQNFGLGYKNVERSTKGAAYKQNNSDSEVRESVVT